MDKIKLGGFREWLQKLEAMTSTSCVANYSRPALPMQRRQFDFDEKNKKKDTKLSTPVFGVNRAENKANR